MAAIEVSEVTHHYGDRQALDAVDFDVEEATIFGFLGPNGGGKTTLFHLLSTLLPLQSGRIQALGFDVAKQAASYRQQIGVTFQAPSLDRRLTVRENLIHQGHLYGLAGSALNSTVDELLNRFGVADRSSDIVDTLSGGLKRRVELAKTLIHRPRLLFLDEPSTGLDPGGRHDLWVQLEQLRSDFGVTVAVTTHLMEEAERCDQLALLDLGKIVATGRPSELRSLVPGECLTLTCDQPELLKGRLQSELELDFQRVGETLRIHRADCQSLFPQIMERYGEDVKSISLGKPTLEDVFMEQTGRQLGDANLPG
jgi:ABC-2 type transport system ATP-binding protein